MINLSHNIDIEQERFYFEDSRKGRFTNIKFELDKVIYIGHYVPKTNSIDDREEANEMTYSWFAWIDRAKLEQEKYHAEKVEDYAIEEINALKSLIAELKEANIALQIKSQKLSEELNCIPFPRKPSKAILEILERHMFVYPEIASYESEKAYEELIKLVEKENV